MTISQRLKQLYKLQLLLTASTVLAITSTTTTVSKTITAAKISSVLTTISSTAQTIIVVVAAYTMSLAREATNKAILDASKCLTSKWSQDSTTSTECIYKTTKLV